jgi:hypothetical protein
MVSLTRLRHDSHPEGLTQSFEVRCIEVLTCPCTGLTLATASTTARTTLLRTLRWERIADDRAKELATQLETGESSNERMQTQGAACPSRALVAEPAFRVVLHGATVTEV